MNNNTELYIPSNATPPTQHTKFRIGIQGRPKTGKTWSALTFPNPFVIDMDDNIPRNHPKFSSLLTLPLWDAKWLAAKIPSAKGIVHDALIRWLTVEGPKFGRDQTIIIDSLTYINNSFDAHYHNNPVYSAKGAIDKWFAWRHKGALFTELHNILRSLSCNVISIVHETNDYDDEGTVIGIKPLITGQFGDQIAGHYCEWLRQVVVEDKETKKPKYLWEVKSKKISCAGGNILSLLPEGIVTLDANYETLMRILNNGQISNR